MSILTYISGWPLLAALALVLVPRNYRVIIRAVAVLATFISMLLAVKMFCQFVTGACGLPVRAANPLGRFARHQLSRRRGRLERRA